MTRGVQDTLPGTEPTRAAPARPTMTETQLLAAVRKLARLTRWRTYHTHDSRRSDPGFPDLVLLAADRKRVIYAELKTDTGRLTTEQEAWLRDLTTAGCETAIWRPADLPEIATVLRGRRITPGEFGTADLPRPLTRWHR